MMKIFCVLLMVISINAFATPVNVNTADAQTIADSLMGVGLKKAQAIVEYRNKQGEFKSVDELSQVSGIGAKTIENNRADILLMDAVVPSTVQDESDYEISEINAETEGDKKRLTITFEKKKPAQNK